MAIAGPLPPPCEKRSEAEQPIRPPTLERSYESYYSVVKKKCVWVSRGGEVKRRKNNTSTSLKSSSRLAKKKTV